MGAPLRAPPQNPAMRSEVSPLGPRESLGRLEPATPQTTRWLPGPDGADCASCLRPAATPPSRPPCLLPGSCPTWPAPGEVRPGFGAPKKQGHPSGLLWSGRRGGSPPSARGLGGVGEAAPGGDRRRWAGPGRAGPRGLAPLPPPSRRGQTPNGRRGSVLLKFNLGRMRECLRS